MMQALDRDLRSALEKTVKAARTVAETAASAAVDQLGVGNDKPEAFLSNDEKALRNRLRTHGAQLGDARESKSANPTYGKQEVQRLVQEVAYQHWHRMLFARFLANNSLLMYDGVAVTIDECDELAPEEGAKSAWELAGKLAAHMLPQVFKPGSTVFELIFAPEHQSQLERLLKDLPDDVFKASDSLGWVYQFWQADNKERINKSEVKIGADELPAVTQLFTEDYMVDFLLDNTLGAWHAGKVLAAHPELADAARSEDEARRAVALPNCPWKYLRFSTDEDKKWIPAAGVLDGWPTTAKELKCLDPCMGSGHFVVAMFERLVALRLAEEKLDIADAVAAVIRDNLFGLEIDPRCTQIGAFNLALAAWRRVGYCPLPPLNLACSGIAPNTIEADWLAIAGDNDKLRNGMEQLYRLFEQAGVLGSLINPRADRGDLLVAEFHELQPLLERALAPEHQDDAAHEMAVTARGLAKAAEILAGQFTLVATNVPYLGRGKQDATLKNFCDSFHPDSKAGLATAFTERCLGFTKPGCTTVLVTPENWLSLSSYKKLREKLLSTSEWNFLVRLGSSAFQTPMWDFNTILLSLTKRAANRHTSFLGVDASEGKNSEEKADLLNKREGLAVPQMAQLTNPDARIGLSIQGSESLLCTWASSFAGLGTGDFSHYGRYFWEFSDQFRGWAFYQTTVESPLEWGGREHVVAWDFSTERVRGMSPQERDQIHNQDQSGQQAWGKMGVAVGLMGELKPTLFTGERYDKALAAVVPDDPKILPALWAFCSDAAFNKSVRQLDQNLFVGNGILVKISFDLPHWQKVAEEKYPQGLPIPFSSDPRQWLFAGHPAGSDHPLHVAVARLLGYQWPRQTGCSFPDCPALGPDGLERHADRDGIVCLPPVGQELSASDRLLNLLADSYGSTWGGDTLAQLLAAADYAGKSLDAWLRDKFFAQHCKLFYNRPFIWHVWDGLRDGFAALLNCHSLDYKTLESLIYTYLGDWINRQRRDADHGVDGAQERLAAAEVLKKRLELILAGDMPYDIFARWKTIEEQPIGWNPDLNDGVRINIRPFLSVQAVSKRGAGVLRDKPNIKWEKDRGRDVSSAPWYELGLEYNGKVGDRINDHHLTLDEKRAARAKLGKA